MSKIAIINPNMSAGFTNKIREQARKIAFPHNEILALNPRFGPDSIEGYYDEAFASVGLLSVIREIDPTGIDGYVVACFDDTGVDAARCLTAAPVMGLCEGALRFAQALAGRYAIVTPMAVSVRPLEHLVRKYGADRDCVVRAAGVRTLDFEGVQAARAYEALLLAAQKSLREDDAEAIVLGCAGMTDIADRLKADLGVPVIDGVQAAIKMVEGMASLKLATSKHSTYGYPPAKPYHGLFAGFEPVTG
ncbi:aspartate/glutamate racemase family protein [Thalassospira mesophila]|uniref:Asp/Glu/hydantoin racemase n=1 Tax=Thalassospira mesophila TaxID=1293891 RepID=A0A1Y2L3Y3_9PROT|nr:aspartate/glutamate racemase family protein [Thalassospira mesophila]OSQ40527.1 Asp/Glu/hydantoin racemase [Thalassospira mesophila]